MVVVGYPEGHISATGNPNCTVLLLLGYMLLHQKQKQDQNVVLRTTGTVTLWFLQANTVLFLQSSLSRTSSARSATLRDTS